MSILNPSGRTPILGDVDVFDCRVTGEGWPWAQRNAPAIAEHWKEAVTAKPDMFDGEVLIATEVGIEKSRLVSKHSVIRYSALNYWKASGFPRADAFNLFGSGVIVTRDGAVLLGEMAAHTSNAGFCYFPCGTPDTADIENDALDIERSIRRELEEETGLGAEHLVASDQRWISWDGPLFCCARRYDTRLTAEEADSFASAHLAGQDKPELARVHLISQMSDTDGLNVPAYVSSVLDQILEP